MRYVDGRIVKSLAIGATLPSEISSWAVTEVVWLAVTRGVHPRLSCAARSEATATNSNDPIPCGRRITANPL
jgi:hypothetical protein